MNAVEISVEGIGTPDWLDRAREYVQSVLARLEKKDWDVSILVCDDAFMRGLNRQYRDRDEPTDVLSFEQGDAYRGPGGEERFLAGDIVISLDALSRNAEEFGISRDEELRRLLVHGILHLSGPVRSRGKRGDLKGGERIGVREAWRLTGSAGLAGPTDRAPSPISILDQGAAVPIWPITPPLSVKDTASSAVA